MEIQNTSSLENHHIFALIVGASGVGKTSLVKTLDHKKTLILSAESGLLSVKDVSVDFIQIKTFDDLIDAYKFLSKNESDYENIFIDSLTEIAEILFQQIKPEYSKSQKFGLYEEYSERLIKFLKTLRDMNNFNIWMTCLDKLQSKDNTEVVTMDLIQKSLSKKIPQIFDEVFYMQSVLRDNGDNVRVLITDNIIIDFAKDRSGKLDRYEKPDLQIITNKIFS